MHAVHVERGPAVVLVDGQRGGSRGRRRRRRQRAAGDAFQAWLISSIDPSRRAIEKYRSREVPIWRAISTCRSGGGRSRLHPQRDRELGAQPGQRLGPRAGQKGAPVELRRATGDAVGPVERGRAALTRVRPGARLAFVIAQWLPLPDRSCTSTGGAGLVEAPVPDQPAAEPIGDRPSRAIARRGRRVRHHGRGGRGRHRPEGGRARGQRPRRSRCPAPDARRSPGSCRRTRTGTRRRRAPA